MDGTGESWFAVSLPPPVLLELISLQPSSLAAGICFFWLTSALVHQRHQCDKDP